jgi:hypothetical protein
MLIKDTEFLVAYYQFINVRSSAFWMAVGDVSEVYISNKVYDSNGKDFYQTCCVLPLWP